MSINPLFRDHINFRDLGGYKSIDGRTIKPGLLFRSGGIYLMDDSELDALQSLGIKYLMDLRTSSEAKEKPDPVIPGIEMVRHSGLTFANGDEIDFSPVGMSKIGEEGYNQLALLKKYYTEIPFNNDAFRILVSKIKSGNVPIVFHCHTGKDRTGVFAIILLLLLGVDKETALKDFMLSNDFHRPTIEEALKESSHKFNQHPELKELIQMRTGVTEKIGSAVISSIANRYGTLEDYFLNEYGLTNSDLQNIRDKYLE